MGLTDITITPAVATFIFATACLAGYRYRRLWKLEGPVYQYWVFGLIAAVGLLVLAFVPIEMPG